MVIIENDERFKGCKWISINGKYVGYANHYSFNFYVDKDSGLIYSEDTDRDFTLEEFIEFMNFIKKSKSIKI